MMIKDDIYMGVLGKKMNESRFITIINPTIIKEEIIHECRDDVEMDCDDNKVNNCNDCQNNCDTNQNGMDATTTASISVSTDSSDFTKTSSASKSAAIRDGANQTGEKNTKLSFSVDRLLMHESERIGGGDGPDPKQVSFDSGDMGSFNNNNNSSYHHNQNISNNNNYMAEQANAMTGFDCCKHLNGFNAQYQNANTVMGRSGKFPNDADRNNDLDYSKSMNDLKCIVRPTPIRISNNLGPSHASPTANLINNYQTVLKFHQLANQFGMMNPLHSLKSLQPADITFRTNSLPPNLKSYSNAMPLNCHSVPTAQPGSMSTRPNASMVNSVHPSSVSHSQAANASNSNSGSSNKRKRSWSRAVFSNLQRKGLEIQFQQQKYITKPDRRKLANRLNLTDAQVKVWFQNRRMKWRHTQENLKSGQEKQVENFKSNLRRIEDGMRTSSDDEDEIDVVAE